MAKNTCCLFPKTSIWILAPSSSGSQPLLTLAPRSLSRYPTLTHRHKTKINLFHLFRCFAFNKINLKKSLEPGWLVAIRPATRRVSQEDCHEFEDGLGCRASFKPGHTGYTVLLKFQNKNKNMYNKILFP